MLRTAKTHSIVEETVAEVMDSALPRLREEIIGRILQELQSLEPAPGSTPADLLNAAIASVQEASTQAEILRHLLEGVARFSGRAALLVIKSGVANGWQATGFENNDGIKSFNLNTSSGLLGRCIQGRAAIGGAVTEFDGGFNGAMGSPADGNCFLLPLVVKDKAAAVIYADAGTVPGAEVDTASLSVLSRFTGMWLELTAMRKAGVTMPAEDAAAPAAAVAPASQPGYARPVSAGPVTDEDIHRKARRFAKLLVDEIKLYNQAKVAEGRQHRDLYERLKDDIEKSRTTYDKRYGDTSAAAANYFDEELIRILADNDSTLMGEKFSS